MGGRGLSVEEKRFKLLEIFHETKDFYQLKELEKLGPKLKGIVSQSVKEILQSLVDDGLVQMDKIGASNFFWSFPSQNGAIVAGKLAKLKETEDDLQKQIHDVRDSVALAVTARVASDQRTKSLTVLTISKTSLASLKTEIEQYGACDPAQVQNKQRAVVLAREAAMRWTDNFTIAEGHFTRQLNISADELRQHLNIPDAYEDIC